MGSVSLESPNMAPNMLNDQRCQGHEASWFGIIPISVNIPTRASFRLPLSISEHRTGRDVHYRPT